MRDMLPWCEAADVRTRPPHLNRPSPHRWHRAEIRIVGAEVRTELDVHRSLERQLKFGEYYGRNVAALRDRLLTDVPRPVRIVWLDSRTSRSRLGEEVFNKIVGAFAEAAAQDLAFGWNERFDFELQ
jgi:ribonuclease inhibitor